MGGEVVEHDVYGMTLSGKRHISTVYNWMNVLYAYDGQTVDSPGHFDYGPVIVNSEEAVKSLTYYKWLVDNTCPPGTVTAAPADNISARWLAFPLT